MMEAFLQQGLSSSISTGMFMTASLTIGTSTLTVARDETMRMMPFMEGGQEAKAQCPVLCNVSDVIAVNANPRLLIGNLATMDGQSWRIADVSQGTAGIRLTLQDPDE